MRKNKAQTVDLGTAVSVEVALPISWSKRGGYPAGDKPVSELAPPPSGPAAGAKPKSENSSDNGRPQQ